MRFFLVGMLSVVVSAQQVITTFAGTDWIFTDDGKPGVNATLAQPVGVASDAKGNIYIADSAMSTVLKLNTSGIVTIVAGNGLRRSAGDGGPARAALFVKPQAVAVDGVGNVYISDYRGNVVRKIAPDGTIGTFAGNPQANSPGDGGLAAQAGLGNPTGLTADSAGNVYIADFGTNTIRKVNPAGVISTIAGNGKRGFAGDNGLAVAATIALDSGSGLAVDRQGNLYFADSGNNRVRKIDTNGLITTLAGGGTGKDGGPAATAQVIYPTGLAFDAQGNLYITEQFGNRVRGVDTSGIITTVAGTGTNGFAGDGGSALQAKFSTPVSVAVDPSGNIFVADRDNQRIRKFQRGGAIATVLGTGSNVGDGGPAANAKFNLPSDVAADAAGNVYIADTQNNRIRKVTSGGVITTVVGTGYANSSPDGTPALLANINRPDSVVIDPQGLLVFGEGSGFRIRRVQTNGSLQTIAGNGNLGETGDGGSATAAAIGDPLQLRYDTKGNLYFIDDNFVTGDVARVRVISPNGQINLFAGNGTVSFSGDGGPAVKAGIGHVVGIATDAAGNVYLAEQGNFRIRKVDTSGIITTIAGSGNAPMSVADLSPDGTKALEATLFPSGGMIVSPGGTLIFSDFNAVRSIAADGTLKTVAGTQTIGFSGDGGLASAAAFGFPAGYAYDPQGNLLVVDQFNSRIREILAGPVPIITLSQKGLTFTTATGATPQPQTFTIVNGALGVLNFGITSTPVTGGNWLSTSIANGAANANAAGVPVTVNVDPSKLGVGDYYGSITINAPGVPNSPQSITVVLHVAVPSSVSQDVTVSPGGFIFTAAQGGAAPAAQIMTLSTLSATPLTYGATLSFGGKTFLTVANMTGTVVTGKPVTFQLQPVITGLTPGVYNANITVAAGSAPIKQVTIFVVVAPPGSSADKSRGAASTCTPTRLLPILTTLSSGFRVTAAFPIPLEVRVVDDCGNPSSTGTVVASFSTGDAPLSLRSLQDGSWGATWQTTTAVNQATITVNAQSGSSQIAGSAQITGGLLANQNPPPSVASGGALNAASFTRQSPLAPGSLISIFGDNLADSLGQAQALPLPYDLNTTEVIMAGRSLPLIFVSKTQINAMIPFDLPVNATHQLIVTRGSTISLPEPVSILGTVGGVFTRDNSGTGTGIVVAVHGDGSQALVDANSPTTAGDVLVIYSTGLGDVNPRVLAGTPAPLTPLSPTVIPVTVSIGGQAGQVLFAGVTPGFTGLYQVNVIVPSGVTPGNAVPLVLTQGNNSSPPVNIAVR